MRHLFLVFFLCFSVFLTISCEKTPLPPGDNETPTQYAHYKSVELVIPSSYEYPLAVLANMETYYALRKFSKQMFTNEVMVNGLGNKVVSTLGPFTVLNFLAISTDGDVSNKLIKGLGLEEYPSEIVHPVIDAMLDCFPETDTASVIKFANSLWGSDLISTESSTMPLWCTVSSGDFKAHGTKDDIDRWCRNSTDGKVGGITSGINGFDQLDNLLASSFYFKGSWNQQFKPDKNKKLKFQTFDNKKVDKEFMTHRAIHFYNKLDDGTEYCEIQFGNAAYSLCIVMPSKGSDILNFASTFDFDRYSAVKLPKIVTLTLPKFSLDYSIDLLPVLKQMGFGDAFEAGTSYPGISESKVGNIKYVQRAAFSIDERGGKGFSTIIPDLYFTGIPQRDEKTMVADHPFLFYIIEKSTNAILAAGMVVEKITSCQSDHNNATGILHEIYR